MKENNEILSLKWDTKHFEVESARINLFKEVSEQDKKDILRCSEKNEFLTISNFNNNNINNIWIGEETNSFLVDTNVQFSKVISHSIYKENSNNIYITNNLPINHDILEIAKDSFVTSRFLNDPYLSSEKASLVYYNWSLNSFNKNDKYFILYKSHGTVIGFLLFTVEKNICIIELIAIDKKFQNENIGSELVSNLENYLFTKEIFHIQVGTQINNISAISFYCRLGFRFSSSSSIYHWWPETLNKLS